MDQRETIQKLNSMIGQQVGVSDWFLIDQDRINRFAECTDDPQWIHVDVARAAAGPFGKTIAPGFLALSLISAMSRGRQIGFNESQVEMLINYGMNKVRFLTPIPVDSKIRSRMVLTNLEERDPGRVLLTTQHTIEIEGQAEPACFVEIIGMYILK